MSTGEREPVHVHVDLRSRDFPAADRVTAFASARHLAAVNVSMAVGALIADVGEDHLGMVVYAVDALVQAAQRKLRLVVVELRHRADRLPSVHGMAVLTSDIQVAVGAARLLCRLRRASASNGRRQQQPQNDPFCDQTWKHLAPPHAQDFFDFRISLLKKIVFALTQEGPHSTPQPLNRRANFIAEKQSYVHPSLDAKLIST